jgi:hypothetical protein
MDTPRWSDPTVVARLALAALLAWHSRAWMTDPALGPADGTAFLHGVSLGMHETGHLVFAPFGETMAILGGSLLQVLLPLVFAIAFVRQRAWYAAAIGAWWVAQNVWDVAVYVADARAEALPLVGGGEHDWAMLLLRWDLLASDVAIARTMSHAAAVVAIVALGIAVRAAVLPASDGLTPRSRPATRELERDAPGALPARAGAPHLDGGSAVETPDAGARYGEERSDHGRPAAG